MKFKDKEEFISYCEELSRIRGYGWSKEKIELMWQYRQEISNERIHTNIG